MKVMLLCLVIGMDEVAAGTAKRQSPMTINTSDDDESRTYAK
jgi:hypothetical protein